MKLKSTRDAYGEALVELGMQEKNIVVLDADLSKSTKTCTFAKAFPDRFFDIGVSEQDMMNTAAGLATCGKIPFASTFAIFATGRCWEQIRNTIAFSNLNVKIVATHGGISVGEDGSSHQSIEDIAIIRAVPNMTVIVPADAMETKKAVAAVFKHKGPVYMRLGRADVPVLFDENHGFEIGKASVLKKGKDITIVACGIEVFYALKSAQLLKEYSIDAEVINMHTIKPLDKNAIIESVKKTGKIITCEEHSIIGGLGGAVAEILSESGLKFKMKRIGIRDEFGESGPCEKLICKYCLDENSIASMAIEMINRDAL